MTYLILLVQQLISSSTHLIAKNVVGALHPSTVVLLRGMFTCAAFGVWWWFRRRHVKPVLRKDLARIVLLGLINMPINQLLFIWGVRYTTAPNASLAYALTPAFVVAIMAATGMQRLQWKRTLGIVIAFFGAALVLADRGAGLEQEQLLGNVMVLCASASWAAFTILGRPLIVRYGPVQTTALTFFAGLALYIPLWAVLPVHESTAALTNPNWASTWMQLFYLGVITSGLGYAMWYYALARMEASRVAVFNNLQPVITSILALIIFGTQPTLLFMIGGAIALVGVVLTQHD